MHWTLQFDGGSRSFSGIHLGGGEWILADPSGKVVQGKSLYFGRKHPTNNAAKLKVLERALAEIEEQGWVPKGSFVEVWGDSDLVVRFLTGKTIACK